MDERIELADGTIIQNSYVIEISDNSIAIYVGGEHTFVEIAAIFTDTSKTRNIVSYQYGDKKQWDGFTEVTSLVINANDGCVTLQKSL